MTTYEQALSQLKELLSQHDTIQSFKEAQAKIEQLPDLTENVIAMKSYQQKAVLMQKLDKPQASEDNAHASQQLKDSLDELPIVQDYRRQMQDASDLLSHITKRIEDQINKELSNGK
ncbi:YlbF family regulator [Streptococcus saliviloxodontae]|uniref:Cell fate (Sporulation/competence/biofilm development) regulator YmcA (YheA/YmcA/DUF963 family) n=1 Tax=Streptococcus saliviloxodontae TaxID=1349416 RepID=A0ABS2PM37_9STRE|nr:YlbF family regulator [Streptococcus saliviloxodontae]MBM7636006.1 cell fate (sporulation/competence/biofilm development) regulator YmcA (YheA/YmcA/DUF963 family) [Streptococcus saliviloxodontae]